MWRSGGSKEESVTVKPARWGLLLNRVFRLLLIVAALFAVLVFVFPALFGPRIDLPTVSQFESPSSLMVQISNQNLTPLNDVTYTCEVGKLELASGAATNAKVVLRGVIRQISGRRGVVVRCESAYIPGAPLKAAEYKLMVKYRAYPWPQQKTRTFVIAAQINGDGHVTGWKLN
jgi:hypothetical protein